MKNYSLGLKYGEQEPQNSILAEIHNRLAEISKFLELIAVKYTKMSADDMEYLDKPRIDTEERIVSEDGGLPYACDEYIYRECDDVSIGFSDDIGLHRKFSRYDEKTGKLFEEVSPLNLDSYEGTIPLDEDGEYKYDINDDDLLTLPEFDNKENKNG